jgi:nucleotide-binding universal stress UspA family protein
MFQRILVPVDGSAGSETAVPYAIDLAKTVDAEVVVCYVITTPVSTNASAQTHRAAQYVGGIAQRFTSEGIATKTQVRRGEPAVEIKASALDWSVDVVVMATHSRRRLEKFVVGSVADQVVRDSHLPVLLVSSRVPKRKRQAA